jgi:NTP pyrophosphatase (non-canonical NTP hydrolase)
MWDEAGRLTEWLGDVPVEAQLLKLAEEVGEVAEAYLGMTGLNRRKGVSHTRDDLMGEVADVIITASVALVRLAGGPEAACAPSGHTWTACSPVAASATRRRGRRTRR